MREFTNNGCVLFGEIIDPDECKALYREMITDRDFGSNLFLDEKDFTGLRKGVNPGMNINFLNEYDLDFIEQDHRLVSALTELLGDDYVIVLRKAICGVPHNWLPDWVDRDIDDVNVANLGAYMKPEYRDITYFRGIDYHQDMIDYPKGMTRTIDPATMITMYVYLHDVTEADSPLHIIPGTHRFGATTFPHQLVSVADGEWLYSVPPSRQMHCESLKLTGGAGFVGMWHNCTLHGTQPVKDESDNMRLSLRYLIAKNPENKSRVGMDDVNELIDGLLEVESTRNDLDRTGKAQVRGNIINRG